MDYSFYSSASNIISVIIGDSIYELDAVFTVFDSEKAIAIKSVKCPDYGTVLGDIIRNHLQCEEALRPQVESIKESRAISLYVDAVLVDSSEIREKYELHPEILDKAERFITAANENTLEERERLRKALKNINFKLPEVDIPQITIPSIPKLNIPDYIFNYQSVLPDTIAISQAVASVSKTMRIAAEKAGVFQESINTIIGVQQSVLQQIVDQIVNTIPKIRSIAVSEERLEKAREAQRLWGRYGWTVPENAKIIDFINAPTSKDEADKTALKYCKLKDMERLFDETKKKRGVRISDYKEAIANYKDRRYKSCAFMLFSLIDASLIRLQRNNDGSGKNVRRATGKRAANNVFNRIKEKPMIENEIYFIFRYENLFACLEKVFEDANDFKKQPVVINRNFLDHGMLTSIVRKKDCIQLFLLYYNWLSFIEEIK